VADRREAILSRLAALAAEIDGINAVVRNQLDIGSLARPAVVIHDGTELLASAPDDLRARNSAVQTMDLSPLIMVIVRAGGAADPGVLMSLYRSQIVAGILRDDEILAAIGTNGRIRYEGCAVAVPDAEAQEHRVELSITFRYPFQLDEL
jgi:hypothetical protein